MYCCLKVFTLARRQVDNPIDENFVEKVIRDERSKGKKDEGEMYEQTWRQEQILLPNDFWKRHKF